MPMFARCCLILFLLCGVACKGRLLQAPLEKAREILSEESSDEPTTSGGGRGLAITGMAALSPPLDAKPRQVIYTAQLRIEVKDFAAAAERVKSIIEAAGGFIADSRVVQDDGDRESGSLEVRVPKVRFNEVLADLKTIGKVKEEALQGQDVTEEYTDLEARLSNARRLETRLLDLLDRESKNIKDLLETERELARVREEVERMEGRKRFLDDRLSLSTITVALFEPYTYTSSVFDPLAGAFDNAGKLLMGSLAVLITILVVALPWITVFGVIGFFLARYVRRWWRKKRGRA
ncbi:MAG: DUF4349 domain-containing protein [Deltaproteobacteria bacterium]|nr:DUF4349 domain-containing protein [Deltaproteobacteria bacterium]